MRVVLPAPFGPIKPQMLPPGNDEPDLGGSLGDSVSVTLQRLAAGTLFDALGDGPLGQLFGVLPQNIRDHIPLSYFAALAVKVPSVPVLDELRRQGNHIRGGSADLGH